MARMELPELKKEFLTIDEVAERWTVKAGRIVSKDRVIAHGEDGSLQFYLIHDMSWVDLDQHYYRLTSINEPGVSKGNTPFSPFAIDGKKLWHVLKSRQPFEIEYLLAGDDGFRESELYKSRYIPISEHNLRVPLREIERFESVMGQDEHVQPAPAYSDPNSDHYAEELDIAIKAHTAVFGEKYGNPYQSNTDRITSWLMKNYPDKCQSEAFVKRIRTVVLPKSR